MSFNNKFLGDLKGFIDDLENVFDVKTNSTKTTSDSKSTENSHNYLTTEERKAFAGLCALEGKSEVEKLAELVKEYIDIKRQRL
ncbi:hypothetical protein [Aphanothece sacrum]|uniref:MAF protein n=1 Tax=Aphanothece sacrum FPU1 TaxID=1920663 RepID=A0A401IM29_APHSA|nr:hypothetical protein [Aphanothece sacrum]GBF82293.1 MAF protein [Aphanothece sacrum FPU1]GBF84194.1 MAF protein [Aphanothece sacrum FPU3]